MELFAARHCLLGMPLYTVPALDMKPSNVLLWQPILVQHGNVR
jgi:hypothetical protein